MLAAELGAACGLSETELVDLRLSAAFHDVGKIGVPDKVLLKPATLADDEWDTMKAHSELGERIIYAMGLPHPQPVASTVRHHHECFDGGGYPDGLSGEHIPLASRILLIVDCYDAVTTTRMYHRRFSHSQAMKMLKSEAGEKSDPRILGIFEQVIENSSARTQ